MTIGIDARLWGQTGVGRYIRNLCINLQKIDNKNSYVLFINNKDKKEVELVIKNEKWKIIVSNSKWHSFDEQLKFPKVLNKENLDLMHFPYFSVPIFYKKPFVVTIHDLILHHFVTGNSSTLPIWLYGFKMLAYRFVVNYSSRKARKIIAVSNATKNEIIDHLIVRKNNVEIIYEAVDDLRNYPEEKIEYNNYFLFVGNVYPHKNVDELLKAFKKFIDNNNAKLIFVGKNDSFYKKLKKQTRKYDEKIIFLENVDDKKLCSLYKNAICLIRPSLMEGFSLPPLEALENKCLVLASDIDVHKEILEDGAIYFDPKKWESLLDKMNFVYRIDKKQRDNLISKGLSISKKFSWEETARKTLKVYESSLGI